MRIKFYTLTILMLLLLSCSSKPSIEVTEIPNELPMIVLPSRTNSDSIEAFIPYSFKVKNGSFSTINSIDYTYKSNLIKFSEWDYLVIDGDSVKTMYSDGTSISGMSSETFTIYLKVKKGKSKIDEKILSNDLFIRQNRIKLLNQKFNRIESNSKYYRDTRNQIELDSIAVTAYYKDYVVIKVGQIKNNKFKTITSDDVMKNPNAMTESIFKP